MMDTVGYVNERGNIFPQGGLPGQTRNRSPTY